MTFTFPASDDADGPWPIFERLLLTHEELGELASMLDSEIRVAFLMRHGDWGKHGRMTLGVCCIPSVQGELKPLFAQLLEDTLGYFPDFLILLNADWWEEASPLQREILVFHEAMHAAQARDKYGAPRFHRETGAPIPTIRGHDVEEFTPVVRRYGAWKSDLAEFLAAAAEAPNAPDNLTPTGPPVVTVECHEEANDPTGLKEPQMTAESTNRGER